MAKTVVCPFKLDHGKKLHEKEADLKKLLIANLMKSSDHFHYVEALHHGDEK